MLKNAYAWWSRLGYVERAFLALAAVYAVLYFARLEPPGKTTVGFAAFIAGLLTLFRLARRGVRQAIWRLRNRLIVAYLFIAVVPIVLILTMVGIAGWAVIGQMAVYLVNKEMENRQMALLRPAEALVRFPFGDSSIAMNRFVMITRHAFPDISVRVVGKDDLKFPPNTGLTPPPAGWGPASGLIVRKEAEGNRLYAWAHVMANGNEATVMAPISNDWLAHLVPGLGDVNIVPLTGHSRESFIPPAKNLIDLKLTGFYPVVIPGWDSPKTGHRVVLLVNTRISAVLGTVFQKLDWAELALGIFVGVAILFLIVETASLIAGVQLSRTITGAVHELYVGTQRVKEADFSYRIPVKGNDQLAELGAAFNTMTENLGRLIVVAKEKERLESELAIAREVQNQLFPKDVPFTKTLELKGVCNPARMVSGDYYDFMALSDTSLAFAIGDVAGKGISAALLMATIQSTMRTQLSTKNGSGNHTFSTAAMVSILNKQLYATTAPEKYATFYFAIYDETTHALTYTNAGHLSPMLVRDGASQLLDSTGTVVGAFPFARYEEKTVLLEHGDILVAYTDGIVEPENAYGEMFGEDRLQDLVLKHTRADSSEMIARTMEAVAQWTGSSELQDDMTMVVARRI